MEARNLLAEPRSAGNQETWTTLVVKFPSEDHAFVSAAAAAAVALTSATNVKSENSPPWHPNDMYISQVIFDVISSRSALSGPGNNGQGLAYLALIIHTDIGRMEFGQGLTTFWWRIIDESDVFPPELWQLSTQ